MEELRKRLNEAVTLYGLNDFKTLKISQEMDILVVEKMKKTPFAEGVQWIS